MNLKATSVGDLAAKVLAKGRAGEVTRVFRKSAYVRSEADFVLLLWGGLRSPMTVNVSGGFETLQARPGDRCALSRGAVEVGSATIEVRKARIFRSSLTRRATVRLPPSSSLLKGVSLLKSLYDASPHGPTLVQDGELRSFLRRALVPLALGETGPIYSPISYARLIGRGGGFTPAGDDFVGGFLSAYNYWARCTGSKEVRIPSELLAGTIPESAYLMARAAEGQVDEVLGSLVSKSLDGSRDFTDEILALGPRGHTSGIDMSLGVLLCEAALSQKGGDAPALDLCMDALWRR